MGPRLTVIVPDRMAEGVEDIEPVFSEVLRKMSLVPVRDLLVIETRNKIGGEGWATCAKSRLKGASMTMMYHCLKMYSVALFSSSGLGA